jgi:hypothetical protein
MTARRGKGAGPRNSDALPPGVKTTVEGSGMTASTVYHIDRNVNPDDLPEHVKKIRNTNGLEPMLSYLENETAEILRGDGLPDYHGSFAYIIETGEWWDMGEFSSWRGACANEIWPLAKARGHEKDSVVGFAARIFSQIGRVRRFFEDGDPESAAQFMFYVGVMETERRLKAEHEPTWESGDKMRRSGRARRRGGSAADRTAAVEKLVAEGHPKTAAISLVAEREGVHFKTIERDLYPPKNRS